MLNYILYFLIALILIDIFFYFFPSKRKKTIDSIVKDLEKIKDNPEYKKAAEDNILFFNSSRSVFKYIYWLVSKKPKLRQERDKLLELADLPLPKWQKETHLRLIKIEKMKFPGLLTPIRNKVIETILSLEKNNDCIVLLNIGSGGMELEKQIIEELLKKKFSVPLVFLCFEISPSIAEVGFSNVNSIAKENDNIEIKKINKINSQILEELKQQARKDKKILINIIDINIFNIKDSLSSDSIDILYHSRLKHHLSIEQRQELDELAINLSERVFEFDDICSTPVFIFPSIITWKWPVTLNGAILSYIRDPSVKELLADKKENRELKLYNNLGYYLRSYDKTKRKI